MTKKAAFWIFLIGTLISAVIFLVLTWDTHRQVETLANVDKLSDKVVAGKRAFEKYNCNDCHTILGFGGYYAPDLTRVVRRVSADGVRYRVKSPEVAFRNSFRKMQHTGISDAEIDDLIAFLQWIEEVNNQDWPPMDSRNRLTRGEQRVVASRGLSPGAAVFQQRGCMNCHALGGTGGTFGPALDQVGARRAEKVIRQYVKDPKSIDPQAQMPPQPELTDRELDEVAKFLATQK